MLHQSAVLMEIAPCVIKKKKKKKKKRKPHVPANVLTGPLPLFHNISVQAVLRSNQTHMSTFLRRTSHILCAPDTHTDTRTQLTELKSIAIPPYKSGVTYLHVTLKAPRNPASENVVCLCRLLNILANFSNLFLYIGKQCGP